MANYTITEIAVPMKRALELKNQYDHLIGARVDERRFQITELIITPSDINKMENFVNHHFEDIANLWSNDSRLKEPQFLSDKFNIAVIYKAWPNNNPQYNTLNEVLSLLGSPIIEA